MTHAYFGIDVSKATLDLGDEQGHLGRFKQTPGERKRLVCRLQQHQPTLVAVEATGGYERPIVEALLEAGIPVAVVQPFCVHHYAKSLKLRAKTDAIDAQLLARYARANQPRPAEQPDPESRRLRALRDRRDQVIEDRVREQNRLESCPDAEVQREIKRNIKRLQKQEAKLDEQIDQCIEQCPALHERAQVLGAVKGVGRTVTATLLAYLPELGRVNRQQIASLVGVAPHPRESGRWKGRRRISGGRAQVRRMLYMAAVTAARHDTVLHDLYRRLLEAGKEKKVALIAVARKLLVRLNTLMQPFHQQNTPPARANAT